MAEVPVGRSDPDPPRPVETELHLRDFLVILRRFRGSAIVSFLGVFIGITLLVLVTPKQYEGEVRVAVVESDPNLSVERTGNSLVGQRTFFDTQLEVLKSRPVFGDVIQELGLADKDLVDDHPLLRPVKAVVRALRGSDEAPGLEERIDELLDQARIRDVRGTDVIQIAVRARSAELARDLANKVGEVFARRNLELKRARTTSDRVYLSKRLESTKQSLIDAENDLRRFEEEHDAVALDRRLNHLSELLIEIEGERTDVDRQIQEVAARLQVTLEQVSDAREGVAEAGSETYAALQQRLLDLRLQREALLKTRTENHPEVQRIDKEIRIVRGQVDATGEAVRSGKSGTLSGMDQVLLQQSRLQQEYEALTARAASIKSITQHYEKQLADSLALKSQFQFLAREMEANQKIYDLLLLRQKEASLREDMLTSDVSVIQPAFTPRKPVVPNPGPSLMLAILAALVSGVGAALVRDYLDQNVRTRQPLERALGLPCLAEVPQAEGLAGQTGTDLVGEGISLVDQVSSLDTSIGGGGDGPQVFLVTSAVPGEGKSTIAKSLAMSFALGRSRTLLIDCDFRKPSLLAYFGVPDAQPLLDAEIDDFGAKILADKDLPELSVVGVRTVEDADPTLLRQRRFAARMMELRGRFDRIVVDSPPLTIFPDALHLAPLVDQVLLVTRQDHSTIPKVEEAARLLRNVRARLVGFVLNGVAASKERYGYAYRYGQQDR